MANTIETLSIEQANRLVRTSLSTKAFIKLEAWKKCKEIKSILNLPDHLEPIYIIPIGYKK